jgi:cob(I)alamin adenosyltransferase
MVRLNVIYTRTGDSGESGLGDGTRRPKTDPRFAAMGDIDETNCALGLARLRTGVADDPALAAIEATLARVQNDLFDLGADLAVPHEDTRERLRLVEGQVEWLEQRCDEVNAELEPLRSFLLSGGTPAAAWLHVCRTVCRRAERRVVALGEAASPLTLRYLNRLSDLLFILAREANAGEEPLWVPGRHR